jgi:hypothetical protein
MIYRAIFRRNAPEIIKRRFAEASDRLHATTAGGDVERYYRAIQSTGDMEALEVACRYTKKFPLLVSKFRLMVYLAETLPENQHFFIKGRRGILGVAWALGAGALRTAFKLVKGLLLMAKVNHA